MNWQYFEPQFEYEEKFQDSAWPWEGHKRFAYDLIRSTQPKRVVELGTHKGTSFFSFCQAIKDAKLNTEIFAIDTWKGDAQAGFYEEDVFDGVKEILKEYYSNVHAKLVRKTFNDACAEFEDSSIDILHIDGFHTYDAVKNDFERWLPKVKPDGIILFHDIIVTRDDFGVYMLWKELKTRYQTMEFRHSYGLGILFKDSDNEIFELKEKLELYYSYLLEDIKNAKMIKILQTVDNNKQEKGKLDKIIAQKDQERRVLNRILEQKNQELQFANAQITELLQAIDTNKQEKKNLDRIIERKEYENVFLNKIIEQKNQEISFIASSKFWKLREWNEKVKFIVFHPIRAILKHKHRVHFAIFHPVKFFKKYTSKSADEGEGMKLVLKTGYLKSGKLLSNAVSWLRFPLYEKPLVSVIIPVYGQCAVTVRCLESIVQNMPKASFEIIVMNDCSPDNSKKILEKIEGIRLISNAKNLGFIRSCNAGAKEARGKYLYFLNNDVEVTSDWMDALLRTFENFPKVGLVGSKLVYPDGKLQEAGGIVWKDGSAWNFGRGQNPMLPRYNYVRETDYCSGASIMLPKKLFEEIGNFDERYIPAYYEDSDLCFEVRKKGYRVMYQPASMIIHYEGVSNGTDVSGGVKAYQVKNAKKFLKKWKEVLSHENFENGVDVFLAKGKTANKKTVLVIDHYVPTFDKDAGSRSVYQYIKMLCQLGYDVKFLGDNFQKAEPYTNILQQMGVEVLYGEYLRKNWKEWIKENGLHIDFVFANRPHIFLKYIETLREYTLAKVIYYGHDLHYLRTMREYEVTKNQDLLIKSKEFKDTEFGIMEKADTSLYPSQFEVDTVKKEKSDADVQVLPLYMYDRKEYVYNTEARKDLLFVGGFNHLPNVDAIVWFCKQIFPMVLQKNPNIKLFVVGSNPTQEIKELASDSVIVRGFVTDEALADLYAITRIVVAPLRYGAGIKGKIIEAMYQGVPVITTSCGAEGIENGSGVLVVADTSDDMSEKIITMYENDKLLNNLSKQGKEFVDKNYSMDFVTKRIKSLFSV